jgi:predicted MPP superfamily phosphohydrolase
MRWVLRVALALLMSGFGLAGYGYWTARQDPLIREARIEARDWPAGERPVRILLISEIHVAGPAMPPSRLERIVDQANALAPDLVLIAGDFISEHPDPGWSYTPDEIAAPIGRLRPRLGTFAVMGNHDHWADAPAITAALTRVGVRVLDNDAARAGPLAVGGVDDDYTGRADLRDTVEAMRRLGGVPVLLSHSPDPFPDLAPDVPLMVAGHTHCRQISLPLIGPLVTYSRYGNRYACGRVDENGHTLVVGAGLGTSVLPLRIGAVPDMWLIEIGAAGR